MSMRESAQFLASSEYLRLITTLVVGYGKSVSCAFAGSEELSCHLLTFTCYDTMMPSGLYINFTEIMWKSIIKKQYPDPLDYQREISRW